MEKYFFVYVNSCFDNVFYFYLIVSNLNFFVYIIGFNYVNYFL